MKKNCFQKSVLDNGIVLISERLEQFQALAIGVWVRAGSRHENNQELGYSHFLEHMMFKGTKNRSALDIAVAVDRVGGEFNAFTTREYTCFHLLLLAQDYKLGCELVVDILADSKLDEAEIAKEKIVVAQEKLMVEDDPEELLHDQFYDQVFKSHPLGRNILGTNQSLAKLNRKTLLEFFYKHYTPEKMIISVAGNVDHQALKKHLNKLFKQVKFPKKAANQATFNKLSLTKPKFHVGATHLKKVFEQSHLLLGYEAISYHHPERFSLYCLNTFLGGGMSSSLFQEIREKNALAYSVYSAFSPYSDTGLLTVYVASNAKGLQAARKLIQKEIAKLKAKPLPEKAVALLKENLKGTILINSDSVESRMLAIAKGELFYQKPVTTQELLQEIDAVDAKKIQAMANLIFKDQRCYELILGK